jgi:hypothetical protein
MLPLGGEMQTCVRESLPGAVSEYHGSCGWRERAPLITDRIRMEARRKTEIGRRQCSAWDSKRLQKPIDRSFNHSVRKGKTDELTPITVATKMGVFGEARGALSATAQSVQLRASSEVMKRRPSPRSRKSKTDSREVPTRIGWDKSTRIHRRGKR